jgi:Uma2 family endonuclease
LDELNELRAREAEARQRFRESLDEDVRAEFINGEVVIQMTSRDEHTTTIRNLGRLLDIFLQIRQLGAVRTEQALTDFVRNDYVPDICYWSCAKAALLNKGTTSYPVPDFICEVLSPSSILRDRGVKFEDYAAEGVSEYWIIDPDARTIEQYLQQNRSYALAGKFSNGVIRPAAIQGLEIPVNAVFDDQANLAALRNLLA